MFELGDLFGNYDVVYVAEEKTLYLMHKGPSTVLTFYNINVVQAGRKNRK